MSNFERWVIAHPKHATLAGVAIILLTAGFIEQGLLWLKGAMR